MTRIRDILNGCFMVVAAPFLFMAYVVMTVRQNRKMKALGYYVWTIATLLWRGLVYVCTLGRVS